MLRLIVIAGLVTSTGGCNVIGPSCMARRETGTVVDLSGEVEPGGLAVQRLSYEASGSQNTVEVWWNNDSSTDPPRLQLFATRVECMDFTPAAPPADGPCATLGRGGWFEGVVVRSLTVTHGRGNPERLGTPPEYKLWIVGDLRQRTVYSLHVSWFYGPDC